MEIVKTSTALTDLSGADVAKSNVIPFRSSPAQTQAALTYSSLSEDRFTPSSPDTEAPDGVADSVTLGTTSDSTEATREARAAAVIAAVQNGTYQVDPKAVATAIVSRMLHGAGTLASQQDEL